MVTREQAEKALSDWLGGRQPATNGWTPVRLLSGQPPRQDQGHYEPKPPELALVSAQGVSQHHTSFTMEDVQVAADGIVDGSYRQVDLIHTGGWLGMWVTTGDAGDGRCTVVTTRVDPDRLRFFKTKCTHRQAAAWLMEFAQGQFQPNWKEWRDCTKNMK